MSEIGTVTERPILFSGAMVRPILAGTKGQTRRIVKTREPIGHIGPKGSENDPAEWGYFFDCSRQHGYMVLARGLNEDHDNGQVSIPCPYGEVGDRLWVRETWQAWKQTSVEYDEWEPLTRERRNGIRWNEWIEDNGRPDGIEYRSTSKSVGPWTPSIHMPRWASRITLEITDIRVQRLQEINEEDAQAEGARRFDDIPDPHSYGQGRRWSMETPPTSTDQCLGTARFAFANFWQKINGGESWSSNPWVWALTFKRVEQPVR